MEVSETRAHTKCRRMYSYKTCGRRFDEHDPETGACPDGTGTFLKHVPRPAASQSFNEGELEVLHFIMSSLLRGGDARELARHPHFKSIAHKVTKMKAQLARTKARREGEEPPDPSGTRPPEVGT